MRHFRTKAETEEDDYFTLPKAVAFLVENNPPMTAAESRQELLKALADSALRGRWKDERNPWRSSPVTQPLDRPFHGDGWMSADVDWIEGTVLVDEDEFGPARHRVLWLPRSSVRKHWGPSPHDKDNSEAGRSVSCEMNPAVASAPAPLSNSAAHAAYHEFVSQFVAAGTRIGRGVAEEWGAFHGLDRHEARLIHEAEGPDEWKLGGRTPNPTERDRLLREWRETRQENPAANSACNSAGSNPAAKLPS